jgi:uncharacterized membrane protein
VDSETAKTLIYVFSSIGIADTLYLIYHKLKGTEVYCFLFPKRWCKKVQHSKQSKTFGIPNSYLGFAMYVMLIVLMLLAAQGTVPYWWIRGIIFIGFGFSTYFLYVQAFVLKAFCTWCVVSAINFWVMFFAQFYLK